MSVGVSFILLVIGAVGSEHGCGRWDGVMVGDDHCKGRTGSVGWVMRSG
jgi:hypothetical protein